MWKRITAFIMVICLIAGFTQGGRLYAKTVDEAEETVVLQEERTVEMTAAQEIGTAGKNTKEQKEVKIEENAQSEEEQVQPEAAEEDSEEEQAKETVSSTKEQKADEEQTEEKVQKAEEKQEEEKQEEEKAVKTETVDETEEPQTEAAPEEDAAVKMESRMSFMELSSIVKGSSELTENEMVKVSVYRNNVESEIEIPTGMISETVPRKIETSHFVGAYVVTESGENEIAYIGSYTDKGGALRIYYAFGNDTSTGILLKDGQYIKLVYKDKLKLTYKIQIEDGTECEDGGTFYDRQDTVDYGNNARIQFKATKRNADEGDSYTVSSVKAVGADGTETEMSLDSDGYAYLKNVTQSTSIYAIVRKVEQYRLVVDSATNSHVCWAGHGDEKNSDPSDPYNVTPSKFCSYWVDGYDDGGSENPPAVGDTVTAAPGGTIYFTMFTQKGYQFKRLMINGKNIEVVYDPGNEYTTDIGNGMTVHFVYVSNDQHDVHLTKNSGSDRCRFNCWVTNVSDDIHVTMEGYVNQNHEILTLAEAEGIESVRASTFDRQNVGGSYTGLFNGVLGKVGHYNFWLDLYDPVTEVGKDISDVEYKGNGWPVKLPDAPYAQSFWGKWENSWLYSDRAHVEMQSTVYESPEDKEEVLRWGSRYVYFNTKPGYDPRTLDARITGKSGTRGKAVVTLDDVDHIANLATTKVTSKIYDLTSNTSLQKAKDAGYNWYVFYEGCGLNMRNLYLKCDPYQFGVEYDLNGGTLAGDTSYTSDRKYTIESGSNKISLPGDYPVKEGMVFKGWKLEATNIGYTKATDTLYQAGSIFTVAADNYEAALETEKIEYQLPVIDGKDVIYVTHTDYSPIKNGNHRFRFVAQWEEGQTAPKAEYTVKIYKEAAPGTADAVEVDGRTYTVTEKSHLGTKGEDIISIQKVPEGYVFDEDKSVITLENFMTDGNTDHEISYYFNLPEWKLSQTSNPEGGTEQQKAAAVKVNDTITYTLNLQNMEKTEALMLQGSAITVILPEGLKAPENVKSDGFDFAYDEKTRTITYTLKDAAEIKAGGALELQYSTKVEKPGVYENQAKLTEEWKTYESEKLYHITVADLTISNTLKGDYADYSKKFKVTIVLTDVDGKPLEDKRVEYKGGKLDVAGGNPPLGDGSLVLNGNNEISIDLMHGQTITLKNLPYGCNYSISQKEEAAYTTTYSNRTSKFYQGTTIPIVTNVWPAAEDFADEYERMTLKPSGIFEYNGEYYAVCREFGITKTEAELGPDGVTDWYGVTKLTGKIHEMEEDATRIDGLSRGDLVKYKDEYYVFNAGGSVGCNPENDTANQPQYHKLPGIGAQLLADETVAITNTCEKISTAGIKTGGSESHVMLYTAIILSGFVAAGYALNRRKLKKNL